MNFRYRAAVARMLLICLFILFRAGGEVFADDFSPARIRDISRAVKLLVTEGNGARAGQGTGFFVSPEGHMLTNYHVVEGNRTIKIWEENTLHDVVRIVAFDRNADVALLETNYPRSRVHYLPLRRSLIELGEPVMVLGYPRAFQLGDSITVTKGNVSSIRNVGEDAIIQFTAFVAGGSSGSPLIDKDGSVAGIVTSELTLGQGMFLGLSSPSILRYMSGHLPREAEAVVVDLPPVRPYPAPVAPAPLTPPPPRFDEPSARELLVMEAQTLLNALGYDAGPVDGKAGPLTAAAVRAFQSVRRVRRDGAVTEALVRMLREEKEKLDAAREAARARDLQNLTDNAMRGNVDAQRELGLMYRDGRGVRQDYTRAAGWLQMAGMHGDAVAQTALASMYRLGMGVPRDYPVSVMWLHRAGEQGHAPAQSALGEMYLNGLGVPPDRVRAFEWYRLAASQGYEPALEALDRLAGR